MDNFLSPAAASQRFRIAGIAPTLARLRHILKLHLAQLVSHI
jgi:hypothetical protein